MYLLRRVRSSFEFLTSNSKEGMTFKTTNNHSIQSTRPKAFTRTYKHFEKFQKKGPQNKVTFFQN